MNFHVGQQVVCIAFNNMSAANGFETMPVVGGVYTIRGFYDHPAGLGLRFEEIVNQPAEYEFNGTFECCFNSSRFRPVKTTDISIFTNMLAPAPKEREPA